MRTRSRAIIGMLALAAAAASCTVKDTEAPALAGPSELALSLNLQATPDAIFQDGVSQSAITITARGPNSQPLSGVSVRLDMLVDGTLADFGLLSSKSVVTGGDGIARVTYTAPPKPADSSGFGRLVTIMATPVGSDFRGAVGREVDLRLFPPGIVLPPPGALAANFNFSPTSVQTFQTVTFDASGTTSGGTPCGSACTYNWTFGDGGTAAGQVVTHEYRAAGSYVATLRVGDVRGQVASTTQTVTVGASTPPTASFVYSPQNPTVSRDIFFNAEASRAAPGSGRRIISYDWDFGSGRTGNGVTVAKRYDTAGSYTVTLTVTDDAFQQGTTSTVITVVP